MENYSCPRLRKHQIQNVNNFNSSDEVYFSSPFTMFSQRKTDFFLFLLFSICVKIVKTQSNKTPVLILFHHLSVYE